MKKNMIALLIASAMVSVPAVSFSQSKDQTKTASNAKMGRVATEVFGRKSNLNSPRLSPDGSKIVFQFARSGENFIAWMDISKKNSQPNIIAKSGVVRNVGDREIFNWRFVGNDRIVVAFSGMDRVLDGQVGTITRLAAYDLEGGKPIPLAWKGAFGSASNIMHVDHENQTMVVQRSSFENDGQNEVVKVDVKKGDFSIIQRSNPLVSSWYTDGEGNVRGGAGQSSGGTQKSLYRSDGKGAMKTISKVKDESFTGGALVPSILTKEPDIAYALSNSNGYAAVYKVNLLTQQVVEKVYETKGYDIKGLIPNKDGNDIAGYVLFNGREYVKYIDETSKQIKAFLDKGFGKDNARLVSRNSDASRFLIEVSKPSQLGTYYFYDTQSGDFRALGFESNIIKNKELNHVEAVNYNASDGMKIQAIVTYPRHRKQLKNLPVIVMPHGGPFGISDEVRFDPWAQSMAEEGYVVIQPNYRGSGGYGAEFVKEGRKPNGYGHRMQDDLNDAVTAFAEKGLIDANRACIMGWSYGGYAAARGAQRDSKIWKCAIAGAGVYDFPKMKSYDKRNLGAFNSKFQATASDLIEVSSARNTDGPWSPILIVAAKEDARIPMEQSQTLVSNLKKSGKKENEDFRYIVQKDGTHNLPYEDVHIEWLEESAKWAQRFNPAYIDSDPDKQPPIAVRSTGKSLASN